MVDNTNKYGSAVTHTVYFTVAWTTTRSNMEMQVPIRKICRPYSVRRSLPKVLRMLQNECSSTIEVLADSYIVLLVQSNCGCWF